MAKNVEKMYKMKGVDSGKYDSCVEDVKRKGKVKNAYAVCAAALKKGIDVSDKEAYTKMKKALVDAFYELVSNEVTMSQEVKKAEETKEAPVATAEAVAPAATETPAAESAATTEAQAAPAVEAPAPKLQAGLFGSFTLGSTLKQVETGNVMSNTKKPMMNYEQAYQESTKNQVLTAEQLKELTTKKQA